MPPGHVETHSEQSIFYSSSTLYTFLMRALYGVHFQKRYEAIASEIPQGASVVDVCAGDCYLYRKHLRSKHVDYLALDVSPYFVRHGTKRGISIREFDVRREEVPAADYVVMQASLYQFLPDARPCLRKLIDSAKQKAIVAEPIRNLSDSNIPFLSSLAKRHTRPGGTGDEYAAQRFDEKSLLDLCRSCPEFERSFLIPGGRELIAIFKGAHGS